MKKKLVLSVLSTAVVASMASAAMAQVPGPGILVGGEVNKYYSLDAFLEDKYFDQALNEILDNQEDSYLVVDKNGNVAPLSQALFAKNKAELDAATRPASKADFNGKTFKYADSDDEWNSATDPDLPDGDTPVDLEVESVSAINAKTIAVKFGVKLDKASAETESNYTFAKANSDAASITVADAKLQEDGKTVLLTLGTTLNNKTGAKYSVNISGIKSYEGNDIAEYTELLQLSDSAAPTVTGISYPDSNTIKVEFSEPINSYSTGVASATKITLDGQTVYVPSSAFTLDTNTYKSFTIDVSAAGLQADKTYGITVSGLSDFAGNTLTKFEGSITLAKDTVPPTVTNVSAIDLQNIKVEFSEKIKANTPLFKVKVDGADRTVTINPFNTTNPDGKTFVAKLSSPLTAGNHLVTIHTFQDLQDNPTNAATATFTKEVTFADTNPVLTSTAGSVRSIGGNYYVVLSFDREVSENGTATVSGTYVANGVTYTVSGLNIVDSGDIDIASNEIAIQLPANSVSGDYTVTLSKTAVVDKYGHNMKADAEVTFSYNANVIPANVSTVTPNNAPNLDTVTVVFDKDVSDDALNVSHYTVDGVQVFEKAIFFGDKRTVKLTLRSGAITTTGAKVFKVSGIAGVKDKTYDGVGTNPPKVTFNENVKPAVQSVELIALDKVRVTFTEDVQNVEPAGTDFEVKVNGNAVTLGASSTVESNGVVVITLPTPLSSSTVPVTVSVVDDGTRVADLIGNKTDVGQTKTATVNFQDTTGQADVAIQEAEAQFNMTTGAFAAGATASTARAKYEAAVTAVNNAGLSTNPTYANKLADLKGLVTIAEAEEFAATADLTVTANYDALFTGSSSKYSVASAAQAAMANATLKSAVGTRVSALNSEKTKLDAALASVDAAKTASDTAVDTTNKTNIDAAEAAIKTAENDVNALSLVAATKSILADQVDDAKEAVADDPDFTYEVTAGAAGKIKVTFADTDVTSGLTTGYTLNVTDDDNYGELATIAADGTVSLPTGDKGNDDNATYTQTLELEHDFWGKSDTVTITITDGTGADTIVVNND